MEHSPTKIFSTTLLLAGILLLGSCVVSKKKFDQKSAALSRMDSLYFVCQSTTRQLKSRVDELEADTARYSAEVRELMQRYNEVSTSSNEEIQQLQQENQELEQQLSGYRITLSKYTVDWRALKDDLMHSDSVLSILSYRMDTLLSKSYLPYQILRNPSELILNLPEKHLFQGRSRIKATADSSMAQLSGLLNEYQDLKIKAATQKQEHLGKLIKVTDHLQLDTSFAPIQYHLDPAMVEDNYSLIFTIRGHRGIFKEE